MPPLNHKCDLEETQTVYSVKFQECNTNIGENHAYTNDSTLVETLDDALTAADTAFDSDPLVKRLAGSGSLLLYEQHDDGEQYIRVAISENRVYSG